MRSRCKEDVICGCTAPESSAAPGATLTKRGAVFKHLAIGEQRRQNYASSRTHVPEEANVILLMAKPSCFAQRAGKLEQGMARRTVQKARAICIADERQESDAEKCQPF